MLSILYFLILMHFLTDFILQGETISSKKHRFNKYMFIHVAITTIGTGFVLSWFIEIEKILLGATISFTTHFFIDIVKAEASRKFPKLAWKFIGLDQMAHVTVLFGIIEIINRVNF